MSTYSIVRRDRESLRSRSIGVDNVNVVHLEVLGLHSLPPRVSVAFDTFDVIFVGLPHCGTRIVAARRRLAQAIRNGHLVGRVRAGIGGVPIDSERPCQALDADLFFVCSWLDEN